MKKLFKSFITLALAAILVACPLSVFAAGGNGDGSGGGKDKPLKVTETNIKDGETVESLESVIFTFSKNVVNESVREKNKELFALQDEKGNPVEIEVLMADDQIEADKKEKVEIKPNVKLEDGKYTAVAKAGIESKSGDVMAEDFVLSFTIGKAEAPAETAAVQTTQETAEETKAPVNPLVYIVAGAGVIAAGLLVAGKKK